MSAAFPEASLSFLRGQDILYQQFNDIDIYVEDTGKERMYFNILTSLLPGVKLSKIFSLGGKDNVIREAQAHDSDNKKVYIVDLDFDDILGKKKRIRNLVYLERYSIENYFIDKNAILEQIREKKPSIGDVEIAADFQFEEETHKIARYLIKVALVAVIVQRFDLGIEYPTIELKDYQDYCRSGEVYAPRIEAFVELVGKALKEVDGSFSLDEIIKKEKMIIKGRAPLDLIPGKWTLALLKGVLQRKKLIYQRTDDSFCYLLAKDMNYDNLRFVAESINRIRQ